MRSTPRPPGMSLTLGMTLMYLGLVVVAPLVALGLKARGAGAEVWGRVLASPETWAALGLSLRLAALAALINGVTGLAVAWVLVRYRFPGRRLMDAMVDIPFMIPGAVGGIMLALTLGPEGLVGRALESLGWRVLYSPAAMLVALVYTGLPLVVRAIQPLLESMDHGEEEAARLLGAGRVRTFLRVVLPGLWPGILAGMTMAFARALGDYGTVIFVSSNLPLETVVASKHLANLMEAWDMEGAAVFAVFTMVLGFALLAALHGIFFWQGRIKARQHGARD